MKSILTIFLTIVIFVSVFSFNVFAVNKEIKVELGSEESGNWEVLVSNSEPPNNIRWFEAGPDESGIGWTKNEDKIKLTQPLDFGDGLISMKAKTACADSVNTGDKIIVKAGDTVIAEITPKQTESWTTYEEVYSTIKTNTLKGPQIITLEWYIQARTDGTPPTSYNLQDLTFVVNAATNTSSPIKTTSSTAAKTSTSTNTSAKTSIPTLKSSPNPTSINEYTNSMNIPLVIGIGAIVVLVGGVVSYILLKRKK